MYTIAVFSPFIGSALAGLTGRWRGARGSATISILGLLTSFVLSLCLCYEVGVAGSTVYVPLGQWFSASSVRVSWGLFFDSLSVCMMFTVTLVSACVHLYSVSYMQNDPHLPRFMSYLSLFTGFMLIRVTAPHMVQMLVGWEGISQCLNGLVCINFHEYFEYSLFVIVHKKLCHNSLDRFDKQYRYFYYPRIPAQKRIGFHSFLFKQILVGFLLGDGWLEKHGAGVRLGISLTTKFKNVAEWYKSLLYGLGYISDYNLGNPLVRQEKKGLPYYQIRTFSFESLKPFYDVWYPPIYGCTTEKNKSQTLPRIKSLPIDIEECLTPLCLAIWVMGDGSGMKDGGFKLATHNFTKEESQVLCDLRHELYGLKCNVVRDGHNRFCIRIWKRSMRQFKSLTMPFIQPSCEYKFRFVKI
jgi:hypothetical protein